MKEINIFDEDGMINKKLKKGMYVTFQYETEDKNGNSEYIENEGTIISVEYDEDDRECDEYTIKCIDGTEDIVYGRDIISAKKDNDLI